MGGIVSNNQHVTDHLANERTYLAWIRTSLGIMAFGFVVEKFSFFIQQFAHFIGKTEEPPSGIIQNYSSLFGILLVAIGALLCIFAFFKFLRAERQINAENYKSSLLLDTFLMIFVFSIGIVLLAYLLKSTI
ncbi:MAG: DUF202 domain-containing protein [Verrucomicrobia bacterium]|nr:DUF202 domain-containing protein [Verrucomicrobiota bacterium]